MMFEVVFIVNKYGIARAVAAEIVGTEAWRIAEVMAGGSVPVQCGTEIPVAPARGPIRTFMPKALYPKGEYDWEMKPSGHMGHEAMQRADAFDLMTRRAKLAHKGKRSAFIPPFTPGQITMGRHYRNLVERHSSAGVRCSSVEVMQGQGSGGDGGYIDAVLRDRDQIKRIRARIGNGTALRVKRQGQQVQRLEITDRCLVDMVCLGEKTLADVLRAHGWAKRGGNVTILQKALADALTRMMGPQRPQTGYTVHSHDVALGFEKFVQAVHEGA
jgi:hypothetical protein